MFNDLPDGFDIDGKVVVGSRMIGCCIIDEAC